MKKTALISVGLFVFVSLVHFPAGESTASLPVPTGEKSYSYGFVTQPVLSSIPGDAGPFAVGDVAGGTLNLSVGFTNFSGPVDIYVALSAPSIGSTPFLLRPDNSLQPLSSGLVKWRAGNTGAIYESLFGAMPLSGLPLGAYYFYVVVTPAQSTSAYYLWMTGFEIIGGTTGTTDSSLFGEWRIYSEYIYFDAGGGQGIKPVTRDLTLGADGTWQFGSSSGHWHVADITSQDWTRWGISPYEATRKIVLEGWNGGAADGPIDESAAGVDFFWVIYHVDQADPGTVWMKFGR